MNIEAFFVKIQNGQLKEVHNFLKKQAQPQRFINAYEPSRQMRAIDFAAYKGKLAILDYLIQDWKATVIAEPTEPSLVYWLITAPLRSDKKAQIQNWIQDNKRLLKMDPSLTQDHWNALLGKKFNLNSVDLYGGLRPIYYAALAENPHSLQALPFLLNENLAEHGWFEGKSLAWLFAFHEKFNLLKQLINAGCLLDLDVSPLAKHNPYRGMTLAYLLTTKQELDLLEQLTEAGCEADLNAAPLAEIHYLQGVSLAHQLAQTEEWELLKKMIKKSPPIDLETAALNESNESLNITFAHRLVQNNEWNLLEEIAKSNGKINLNAAPLYTDHLYYQVSVAFLLAHRNEWALLEKLALLSPSIEINTIIPKKASLFPDEPGLSAWFDKIQNRSEGISLAWLLAFFCKFNLLSKWGENLKINLNAALKVDKHVHQGITLGWLLAFHQQWQLLAQWIDNDLDLNAGPSQHANHPQGMTLAYLLATNEQWQLFHQWKGQSINLDTVITEEGHPFQGISLAYLFALHQQWQLLDRFSDLSSVDLDAMPLNPNHLREGVTLSWLLFGASQWQLLNKLAIGNTIDLNVSSFKPNQQNYGETLAFALVAKNQTNLLHKLIGFCPMVDLNAGNSNPTNINFGITLARVLASRKLWVMLDDLIEQSQSINLKAAPLNTAHTNKGISLLDILISNYQWELIRKIINKNFQCKVFKDFEEVRALSSHHLFQEFITLFELELQKELISKFLKPRVESKKLETELQRAVMLLSNISKGYFFHAAQAIKASLLIRFQNDELIEELLKLFPPPATFFKREDNNDLFQLLLMEAIIGARNARFGTQLIEPYLKHISELEKTLELNKLQQSSSWTFNFDLVDEIEPMRVETNPQQQIDLSQIQLLIEQNNWSLLKNILSKDLELSNTPLEYIESLRPFNNHPIFQELLTLKLLEHHELVISSLLINFKTQSNQEELIYLIAKLSLSLQSALQCIDKLNKNTVYYQQAKDIQVNLLTLFFDTNLPGELIQTVVNIFPKPTQSSDLDNFNILKLLRMRAIIKAADINFGIKCFEQILEENRALEKESKNRSIYTSSINQHTLYGKRINRYNQIPDGMQEIVDEIQQPNKRMRLGISSLGNEN